MKLFQIFFQHIVNIVFIVKRCWFTLGLQYRAYIIKYLAAVQFELLSYLRISGVMASPSDINVTAIKKGEPPKHRHTSWNSVLCALETK